MIHLLHLAVNFVTAAYVWTAAISDPATSLSITALSTMWLALNFVAIANMATPWSLK